MKTKKLQTTTEDIQAAAELLRCGELVAFPTETVYGLGADARREDSVRAIFAAKGRPADNPLIVHICSMDMLDGIVSYVPPIAHSLAKDFWPGPLTMVLPKKDTIPSVTSGGLDTVGIRMPSHPAALELIRVSGCPIAAPSANRSGSPSPTTAKHVMDDMDGRISAVIDGGLCEVGVESTVICFDDEETIHILRPGLVSAEDLEPYAAHVYVDEAVFRQIEADAKVASPGMKYRHYAPHAKIIPVDAPDFMAFEAFVASQNAEDTWCLLFDSDPTMSEVPCTRYGDNGKEQAHLLFLRFRELDEQGAKLVYVRMPKKDGADLSVYNRLMRAAGFEVIKL
ncbi:MAG: threonylcarbamoyl-AMP synthase [Oscillospiraceae bacterium]|nr:threonylcarbamoyl-AMP synthase [Oscillospiraceae bacterium]